MGETVEFPSNGHTCSGYLATPASGRGPGVVVIQEWWGLVPHIRDLCDRFAAEGFVALAPDLYHGKETKEPDEAGKLLMELDLPTAARDMLGAGTWLAQSDKTAGDRVGIVGFCMGGALALYAATLSDVFAAVVPFYPYMGVTAAATPEIVNIKGAVLGHFATKDEAYTPEQVATLEAEMRNAGIDVEFFWYEGADHAFFNDTRPEVFDEDAARLSWDRTRAFFRTHLATTVTPV
ncbi:MAG TPA: dienelactone hydrolase family protein [Candidatus Saccharimonadales bacterium]|nr:dienelactone hydrolase family protein [Candidatus Saccharimonadales bacterium]